MIITGGSISHFSSMFTTKHEHPVEHSSIVNDNVVERASSMAEKIASGDYRGLISARNYGSSR